MMAKRNTNRSTTVTATSIVNICAFVALSLSALLYVVGGILNWCGFGSVTSALNMIASYALLVAIAIPAWRFVRSKKQVWRIIYVVALVIYVFGVMFGYIARFF